MNSNQNGYKIVEFNYPSSPNAVKFGFAKQGCYSLHTASLGFVPFDGHKTIAGFATVGAAREAGEPLPFPWHPEMSKGWRAA